MATKVTAIPATLTKFSSQPIKKNIKRRVAGYARVSTDHDEQYTSYEAQVSYYTDYITQHDNPFRRHCYSNIQVRYGDYSLKPKKLQKHCNM